MVFSSLFFIFVFLPLTLIIYYIAPFRYKNAALLLCSLIFYAWGEPVYVILMILNILFNYIMGLDIELNKMNRKRAKILLIFAVIINLSLLGFFKYYGFIISNINHIFSVDIPYKELGLPIGISFYTFQVLSYIIDVYKDKIKAQKNIITLGVYVTMFPQLIAGPIVQYSDIEFQLAQRRISAEKFGSGMKQFIIGLSKKVLFANNIGSVFDTLSAMNTDDMSVLTGWILCAAFTFQIYFDFSGYSDMALGLGRMLGFDFMPNFNYPYISQSASEFWRRWHISLGSWFRDYVYIPLGGNMVSTTKHIRNLMVVWMLTGFWHGASWNFVIWGLYYGIILTLEKYLILKRFEDRAPAALMHIYTMIIVMIGWVIFASSDMSQCFSILSVMFGFVSHPFADTIAMYYLTSNLILIGIMVCASTPIISRATEFFSERLPKTADRVMPVIYASMLIMCIAYLVNETYNPFLYFRF
ncbi:MAG: MBOAT family protein [Firmicutes bacterium]|nr:MBOAT family protein [Bacillota bacterium]